MAKKKKEAVAHSERAHSTLGASSAKRWINCPGSVAAIAKAPPQKSNFFAEEGTFAHELGERCLEEGTNAIDYLGETFGSKFEVTNEMAKAVQEYVDFIYKLKEETQGEWLIEHRFSLPHLHPKFFGTNDAIVYEDFGTLHVADYKHGAGIAVEVEENEQLMYYALGGLSLGDFDKVVLHVIQPRAFHPDGGIRSWETTPEFIKKFGQKLKIAALETEKEDAPLKEGEWCRFCAAAQTCPKLQTKAMEVAKLDFDDVDNPKIPSVKSMTIEQIAKVVEHKKIIETLIKNCEQEVYDRLMEGEDIPGVKLVKKRSKKEWLDERKVIEAFQPTIGEDLFETKLLSVSKLSKLVKKGTLDDYFEVVETGLAVAPQSDRRHAVAPDAKKDFEQIESDEF